MNEIKKHPLIEGLELSDLKSLKKALDFKIVEIEKPAEVEIFKRIQALLFATDWEQGPRMEKDKKDYRHWFKNGILVFNCPHMCNRIHFTNITGVMDSKDLGMIGNQAWISNFSYPGGTSEKRAIELIDKINKFSL